jgi:beta-xylosidase
MEDITCYQNPILTAKTEQAWSLYGFGDPFVMRHNGVYYLYCSTKDGSVGVKCWSSPDLINWTFECFCTNHPVTRGAYAPEVYYYNGYFYMYTSPAGNGHYVLRSNSPTKGFTPVTDNMGMSIDGSVFVDNDGEWYFYTAGGGNIQVYNMESPTTMRSGRALRTVSVNGGWTEGSMTVYHDGYYYITYTGNHVLSPSYRILYGVSDRSPLDFTEAEPRNPLLISTTDAVFGIGHSSTVKGPDLDSYYIVYHSLVDMMPNRNMNIDRIWFNGERMEILGPTADPQPVPELPDVYHYFAPGSSLKGWSLEGSFGAGRSGLSLSADSMLLSKIPFEGDFTAEYNVTSVS